MYVCVRVCIYAIYICICIYIYIYNIYIYIYTYTYICENAVEFDAVHDTVNHVLHLYAPN